MDHALSQKSTTCADFTTGIAARKPRQRALTSPRHPQRPHSGIVCCCVQRTAYRARLALPCIFSGDDSVVFGFFVREPLTFDLDTRDFCTVHPPSFIILRLVVH